MQKETPRGASRATPTVAERRMTIARRFNAGYPQTFQVPEGRPDCPHKKWQPPNHPACGQPSRRDWWPCSTIPALKRRAKLQTSRGCRVICTQLTKLCDNRRQTPVLQTALLLGLRSPRRGLSCRGCMRLIMTGDSIVSDAWDAEHLNRIQTLRRPKCLVRN